MEFYCVRMDITNELSYELLMMKQEKFSMSRTWFYLRHSKNRREVIKYKKKKREIVMNWIGIVSGYIPMINKACLFKNNQIMWMRLISINSCSARLEWKNIKLLRRLLHLYGISYRFIPLNKHAIKWCNIVIFIVKSHQCC